MVTLLGFDTCVDLILLEEKKSIHIMLSSMLDFDLILGIDWKVPHHAVLDYYANIITLEIPGCL